MLSLFTRQRSMPIIIVQLMSEYLAQQNELVSLRDSVSVKEEYNKLVELGLGKTENAKVLKDLVKTEESRLKAEKVLNYIKHLNTFFGDSTFLISYEQFRGVCKKYSLNVGLLEDYTGVIPKENIDELYRVKIKLKDTHSNYYLNESEDGFFQFFIKKVIDGSHDIDDIDDIEEMLEFNNYLVNIDNNYSLKHSRTTSFSVSEIINYQTTSNSWMNNIKYKGLVELRGKLIYKDDFLIAAPDRCFSDHFKIIKKPVDPIVFQTSPFGIVIHSIWGQEADDSVIKKYKKFNQDLLWK